MSVRMLLKRLASELGDKVKQVPSPRWVAASNLLGARMEPNEVKSLSLMSWDLPVLLDLFWSFRTWARFTPLALPGLQLAEGRWWDFRASISM